MNLEFLAPGRLWWLLAVAGLAGLYIAAQFFRSGTAVRFSNLGLLDKVAPTSGAWKRHLVAGLHLTALVPLVIGLAQPQNTEEVAKERSTIILAIDTSLSMEALDVKPSRIESAKVAATAFVRSIPRGIQVGLVKFSGSAAVVVPPTDEHGEVERAIKSLRLDQGTAIGDAVQTSLDSIESVGKDSSGESPKGVIVLLSDGKTTMGMETLDSIPAAKKAGVPVWTIAYGTEDGFVEADVDGSGVLTRVPVPVDTESLKQLAEATGGQSFQAESANDLNQAYAELGGKIGYDLELVEITWKFIAVGIAGLMCASALSLWWFRRLT
ncbi:MAG TPA: VWA domain-containing protein [Acidimicrobiaceae bacterium]|jgi:Ca-activated chloride channel family protein|nr:VWA domain-containing protein [Acidimicrobiaceae bacterium]